MSGYKWGADPYHCITAVENERCCPVCVANDYIMHDNGFKEFYCALGHDQNGGTRGQADCEAWRHKGVRRVQSNNKA